MNENNAEIEWCTPQEALEVLEVFYNSVTAKELIADKLKDGLVRTKAGRMWRSSEPELSAAMTNHEAASVLVDSIIDAKIWRKSRRWRNDKDIWKWSRGMFVITRKKSPADRTVMTEVKFAKVDIQNMAAGRRPKLFLGKKTGAKPNYEGWAKFAWALVLLDRHGKLTAEKTKNKTSLATMIYELTNEFTGSSKSTLDLESIRKPTAFIWDKILCQTSGGFGKSPQP